jgi:hypothetical protein
MAVQLLACREYSVIDYQTLVEFTGHERLFRAADGSFLLHMSSERKETENRIICLAARGAIWRLNESLDEFGSLWEFGELARASDVGSRPVKRWAAKPTDILLLLDYRRSQLRFSSKLRVADRIFLNWL